MSGAFLVPWTPRTRIHPGHSRPGWRHLRGETLNPNHFMTPAQLSAHWSIPVGSLANMRSRDQGPSYMKMGSRVRYPIDGIREFEHAKMDTPGFAA